MAKSYLCSRISSGSHIGRNRGGQRKGFACPCGQWEYRHKSIRDLRKLYLLHRQNFCVFGPVEDVQAMDEGLFAFNKVNLNIITVLTQLTYLYFVGKRFAEWMGWIYRSQKM